MHNKVGSGQPNNFHASGGDGYSFAVKAEGTTSALVPEIAEAAARAEITFGSKQGYVLSVRNQQVETATDLTELMSAIRWAYHYRDDLPPDERWEKDFVVIVSVASATSVIAVAAESSDAAIAVSASANAKVPTSEAELRADMNITHTKAKVQRRWEGPATGYAVQALKLDPSMWTRWDREKLKFLASARSDGKPARPASYAEWARTVGAADPLTADVQIVTPSTTASALMASD